jgi:hypothetical protein
MSLRFDLSKGTIKQDIAQLPDKMLEWAYEVLLDQAGLIRDLAKVYVRVDTGSLRDSIRLERVGPTRHHHKVVRVRAGGYVVNPVTKKLVNYAGVVESKYPYMRPAFQEVQPTIAAMIKNKVVSEVNK